uniref:ORF28 n=1 Tax=Malaco herpesvirus 2 TaxID=3031798 RepID=A0AA48SF09_9VIRU|nr:TPA_asm: ORF28 [Malaco herpesvirus 2]
MVKYKFKSAHLVIIEGVPGAGKSTLVQHITPILKECFRNDIVYLNNKPLNCNSDELVLDGNFLKLIYDHKINGLHLNQSVNIGFDMIAAEQSCLLQFERSDLTAKRLILIQERTSITSFGIFSASQYYHLREAPCRNSNINYYDNNWECVKRIKDTGINLSTITYNNIIHFSSCDIIFMECSAENSLKNVQRRGRMFEKEGYCYDYAKFLEKAQLKFLDLLNGKNSDIYLDRVSPIKDIIKNYNTIRIDMNLHFDHDVNENMDNIIRYVMKNISVQP